MARNQVRFREINERLKEINETFDHLLYEGEYVCECSDLSCTEMLSLTLVQYQALRAHERRFAVKRGHVLPAIERVVGEHDGYVVVEKLPDVLPTR